MQQQFTAQRLTRNLCILAFAAFPALSTASAKEIEVTSSIDAAIVYPDGATVTRVIRVDLDAGDTTLIARDFPLTLDPASLRVEGLTAARVVIGAIDARTPPPSLPETAPDIEKRIEALRDQRTMLDDQIAAQTARKRFTQRFAEDVPFGLGDKADARPIADWRAAFAAVGEEIVAVDNAIRDARLKQREIDRQLASLDTELRANPPGKMEVRVELAADAVSSATFRVSYTVRGARWTPIYDARLERGGRDRKPSLELVRRAEIVQQTGEDWADVALSVSTVRTAKGGDAPDLQPLLVRYRRLDGAFLQDRIAPAAPTSVRTKTAVVTTGAPAGGADVELDARAEEREASFDAGGFQVVFQIPGRVSVGTTAGTKSFRITTATLAPDVLVRATPALDGTAFIEAAFKQGDEAPILPGRVALYRDGVFVGNGRLPLIAKDEPVRIGFGADDQVKVMRVVVRQNEAATGFISSAKTDEREYKITVRNGHDRPVHVVVEDQVPVSETADVGVEMLAVTTPPTERDARDRRGVVAWAFDAAAGEMRDIKFGWRVRWPADKAIVYEPLRP